MHARVHARTRRHLLKILIRSFIFQVLHFSVPQIPVHISPPFSISGIFHMNNRLKYMKYNITQLHGNLHLQRYTEA